MSRFGFVGRYAIMASLLTSSRSVTLRSCVSSLASRGEKEHMHVTLRSCGAILHHGISFDAKSACHASVLCVKPR